MSWKGVGVDGHTASGGKLHVPSSARRQASPVMTPFLRRGLLG
jgi:hypothetical protein